MVAIGRGGGRVQLDLKALGGGENRLERQEAGGGQGRVHLERKKAVGGQSRVNRLERQAGVDGGSRPEWQRERSLWMQRTPRCMYILSPEP